MAKVAVRQKGDVVEMVLIAPPLNLFDSEMVSDVEAAVTEVGALARTGEARAMVFRAEGKVFCGGVDVHEFQGLTTSEGAQLMARALTLTQLIEGLPIPTLAVIHGLNLTIGLELSLACDMMWASSDASFGLVEATVGLTPGAGGTQRMAARAGVARAAEFVMTGDVYTAAELHAWGVVNRVLPAGQLIADSEAFATRLAATPTVANAVAKRLLRTARDHGVSASDAITAREVGPLFATQDIVEGLSSLLERGPRKATFSGR